MISVLHGNRLTQFYEVEGRSVFTVNSLHLLLPTSTSTRTFPLICYGVT